MWGCCPVKVVVIICNHVGPVGQEIIKSLPSLAVAVFSVSSLIGRSSCFPSSFFPRTTASKTD